MKFPVGTRVTVDHARFPGVWTVRSNGPKNATLDPEHGGRGLRIDHESLRAAPAPGEVTVTSIPVQDKVFFSEGEIVRITAGRYAGVWTVIKDNGSDKVNLAAFGGDNGRYLRVSRSAVHKIDAEIVAAALATLEGK